MRKSEILHASPQEKSCYTVRKYRGTVEASRPVRAVSPETMLFAELGVESVETCDKESNMWSHQGLGREREKNNNNVTTNSTERPRRFIFFSHEEALIVLLNLRNTICSGSQTTSQRMNQKRVFSVTE